MVTVICPECGDGEMVNEFPFETATETEPDIRQRGQYRCLACGHIIVGDDEESN